jgi:3-oxoacyl-[acyl-carrier protein] reductase
MQSVIVTGGASGIGRAIVETFSAAGSRVSFIDVDPAGETLAAQLRESGRPVDFYAADIADWDKVAGIVEGVAEQHGIDVAVANAGIVRRVSTDRMGAQAWDLLLDVNLRGAAAVLTAAARFIPAGGALVAVSSTSALQGWAEHAHYNASKAGLVGLVKGMAAELGPRGIRVNAVLPGVIRTPQSLSDEHSIGAAGIAAAERTIPLRRAGTPADVAAVVGFLASPAAAYVTGHALVVDGGLTAGSY